MCLLTFFPDGVFPNDEAIEGLRLGAKFNADGHGYAMIADTGTFGKKHIITYKGLDAEKVLDRFLIDREMDSSGPAIFHSRIGTDGWLSDANCHPFFIGQDQKTVLAHNGILPSLARPTEKHDPRSDTRILAEELLPEKPFGYFHSRLAREAFEAWLGPFNKVIILTVNSRYPSTSLIFNQEKGHWANEAWWSNDSYLPYTPPKWEGGYTIGKRTKVADDESPINQDCASCGEAEAVDRDYRVCWTCGTCADCLGNWSKGECLCYIQSRGATKSLRMCEDCTKYVCVCEGV